MSSESYYIPFSLEGVHNIVVGVDGVEIEVATDVNISVAPTLRSAISHPMGVEALWLNKRLYFDIYVTQSKRMDYGSGCYVPLPTEDGMSLMRVVDSSVKIRVSNSAHVLSPNTKLGPVCLEMYDNARSIIASGTLRPSVKAHNDEEICGQTYSFRRLMFSRSSVKRTASGDTVGLEIFNILVTVFLTLEDGAVVDLLEFKSPNIVCSSGRGYKKKGVPSLSKYVTEGKYSSLPDISTLEQIHKSGGDNTFRAGAAYEDGKTRTGAEPYNVRDAYASIAPSIFNVPRTAKVQSHPDPIVPCGCKIVAVDKKGTDFLSVIYGSLGYCSVSTMNKRQAATSVSETVWIFRFPSSPVNDFNDEHFVSMLMRCFWRDLVYVTCFTSKGNTDLLCSTIVEPSDSRLALSK